MSIQNRRKFDSDVKKNPVLLSKEPVADNLLNKEFNVFSPECVFSCDITPLRVG